MVAGLAFLATAIATRVRPGDRRCAGPGRERRTRAPGPSRSRCSPWPRPRSRPARRPAGTEGTFRAFYLLGAIAQRAVARARHRLPAAAGAAIGDRVRAPCSCCSPGSALGVMLAAPMHGAIAADAASRSARTHFGVLPACARRRRQRRSARSWCSAARCGRRCASRARGAPGSGRLAGGNALIALGTLVLSSGGLLQGIVGHDEAFALTLAAGIAVIYAGFVVASGVRISLAAADDAPAIGRRSVGRQCAAQQLARERARQLVDELDARRQLVAREPAARVPQQLDRVGRRARLRARRTRRPSRRCADAARRRPRRPRRRR